jgi:predicted transcriptional regulator
MKKEKSRTAVTKIEVLKVLSDDIALRIFSQVKKEVMTSEDLINSLNLSKKQYYTRASRLLNASLIRKNRETYTLTSLGKLVYEAHSKISKASRDAWKLNVLDTLASNNEILEDEYKSVTDKLIDDPEIKKLVNKTIKSHASESSKN